MLRGLNTAASGLLSDERLQQILTNNIANADTPGFKASQGELLSFPQQLELSMMYGDNGGTPIGKMGTGVGFQEGVPLFLQGQLQSTGRNLDVALQDADVPGTFAAISGPNGQTQSVSGAITAGAGGVLEINGQPLAVLGADGNPMAGVTAVKNPAYQGTALTASDGKPDYDANGNPSYVFAQNGAIVGQAGQPGWTEAGLRVGGYSTMGNHSFFAVAYQSPEGPSGIALTRDGHFTVDSQHILVDSSGNAVLPVNANGQVIPNGRILVNPNYTGSDLFQPDGSPVVDKQGQSSYTVVNTNQQPIAGKLGAVAADVTQLTPLGQTEYQVAGTFNPTTVMAQLTRSNGTLNPGEQENSNVDVTSSMVQMQAVLAQYEANQRVIQTMDTLLQSAVTDVGKVNA